LGSIYAPGYADKDDGRTVWNTLASKRDMVGCVIKIEDADGIEDVEARGFGAV
jgi:hypothetical protein